MMLISTLYLLYDQFLLERNRHVCAEYCIPYRNDMADSGTCVCYDDRYIEVVSVQDIR